MSSLPKGSHDYANVNSFGFNVMGYYHPPYNHDFTTASQNALMDMIAWRMPSSWSPYGVPAGTYCNGDGGCNSVGALDGHNRVYATACPGATVYDGARLDCKFFPAFQKSPVDH